MRAFIAIELPADVRQRLDSAGQALTTHLSEAGVASALRWSATSNLHLTLRFLGDTTAENRSALVHALQGITKAQSPFSLGLDGLGAFPNWGNPRVVWVGVTGDLDILQRVQRRVEEEVQGCGFAPESRPYHPHITLARAARDARRGTIRQAGELLSRQTKVAQQLGHWTVSELVLMRSELRPGGSVYTVLERFALAGGG